MVEIEQHPLKPFLPDNARLLLLGSFPPPHTRWSIEFYYPNYQNDMWRIWGLLCFGDKDWFCLPAERRFNLGRIVDFCRKAGLAIYDTASAVRRLNGDASDKFLEVAVPTDIEALLGAMPSCRTVAATGGLAAATLAERYGCPTPPTGGFVEVEIGSRRVEFWRMPSSSRAYPSPLEHKAAAYALLKDKLMER